MKHTPLLKIEQQDEIVLLQLDRGDKGNALNNQLIDELGVFFTAPPTSVRAVVLHADGSHFCAGLDLFELLSSRSHNTIVEHRRCRAWHRTFDQIQFGEIPVISVLKGAVTGGGLELASSTHVRVAEKSTYFELPEGQRGIFLGGGGSVRIPRIIGAGRVVEMMLTGRKYNAEQGLQLGLAHYVVDDGAGLVYAINLARAIATNAPTSNYAIINGVSRIADMAHGEGLFAETMVATMTGSDAAERINGFFKQRSASSRKR